MTTTDDKPTGEPRKPKEEREIAGTDSKGDIADRERREAASSLLSPAISPAGAGAMIDADPRLDDRSETEKALERAKGTPD